MSDMRKWLAAKILGGEVVSARLTRELTLGKVAERVECQLDEARTARKRLVIDWQRICDELL